MGYRNLQHCVADLEQTGRLVRVSEAIDARLEAAEIQRRVFASGGPAVLFQSVKNCRFPMVSNLFGSMERVRYIFRDTLAAVRSAVEVKADPSLLVRRPWRLFSAARTGLRMSPRYCRRGPILKHETKVSELPQLVSWPEDGGPFVTLPLVYTEHPDRPGLASSNLGMYRVQLAGNDYVTDEDVGFHYQIHRGIGVHHAAAMERYRAGGEPLRVNVFVGGAPAMSVAAVMPLPEGLSELRFAGALAGHRIPMIRRGPGHPAIYAEADFCISGVLDMERLKPEGPFGDHLGYYSLKHDFPVMKVEKVWRRPGAIWPFTVVGRPPQEDTHFGKLIHELTGPVIPTVVPGVKEVNAVDAAGVHPLLLAIGSERYRPYAPVDRPAEILTQANAILGQGQLSLAKYLWIVAANDDPDLKASDITGFFRHALRRVDWRRDLHFQTCTTIDTLDYTGSSLNEGSKVVIAAAGSPKRELPRELPTELRLPEGFDDPRIVLPGAVAIGGPSYEREPAAAARFCEGFAASDAICAFPLILLCDDAEFTARCENNWLWIAFTRSSPAKDLYGIGAFIREKHWGCEGSLVIDARYKPNYAPPLVEDPEVTKKIDALAARGGPLARWL